MKANRVTRRLRAQTAGPGLIIDQLAGLLGDIEDVLELTSHAEDEISHAMARNPAHADRIWHSFRLLPPPSIACTTRWSTGRTAGNCCAALQTTRTPDRPRPRSAASR